MHTGLGRGRLGLCRLWLCRLRWGCIVGALEPVDHPHTVTGAHDFLAFGLGIVCSSMLWCWWWIAEGDVGAAGGGIEYCWSSGGCVLCGC